MFIMQQLWPLQALFLGESTSGALKICIETDE
jgi:hypothetical protein